HDGHIVDVINANESDGARLPGYDYVAIVTETLSFFSARLPDAVKKILDSARALGGKKGAAFVRKGGFRFNRALAVLMNAMEKEGMVVNWSDILLSVAHAEAMGKRIGA
ncbi:MAG: hypothetical protein FWE09_03370, partial [Treponema sp.]|nr:hypothetical protein [Treponema sp.]